VVRELLRAMGEPILSSTLLLPGEERPMTDGWEIKDRLDHVVDAVIDSGECGLEPTTVVDYTEGYPEVARVGAGDPTDFS
jgi:tRNA A37 threonylcarbamoyladenosine synthetase subunit TsaC/SUA5/YrdC